MMTGFRIPDATALASALDYDPERPALPNPNASAVYLTKDGNTALVKLHTPDGPKLPYPPRFAPQPSPHRCSSIVLNFTISANRQHLMLDNQLLALGVPNPSIPPAITALQVHCEADLERLANDLTYRNVLEGTYRSRVVGLDYKFSVITGEDQRSRRHYRPKLRFTPLGIDGPLDQAKQRAVLVSMQQLNGRDFTIEKATFQNVDNAPSKGGHRAQFCSIFSWRCADLNVRPWYREVWRADFDQYGRKGCLRREVVKAWAYLWSPVMLPARVLLVVCAAWRVRRRLRRRPEVLVRIEDKEALV